jgi:hypothetical protein
VTVTPPPAEGIRLQWDEVPEAARRAFEDWAGSSVVAAVSQPSGFSPGVAARVRLADGRRVFVKAIGPKPNPDAPAFHRVEARIASALPAAVLAPRLRWTYDEDHWVLLAFDEIEGRHPAQPWRDDELQRVIDSMVALAVTLTPSPLPAAEVRTLGERLATRIRGWQSLRDAPPDGLDEWSRRHLGRRLGAMTAETSAGLIMVLRHRAYLIEEVQFHPESILTTAGKDPLRKFLRISVAVTANEQQLDELLLQGSVRR